MSITLKLADLPEVACSEPILHDPTSVGSYGSDASDNVIPEAVPSRMNPLPYKPTVTYDHTPMPWTKNPIDRSDLPIPVQIPDDVIFTNRSKLSALLKIFVFPGDKYFVRDVKFRVHRVQDKLYFLEGALNEDVGMHQSDNDGRYGVPFEKLLTTCANPIQDKFFMFQSYTLVGVTNLLVRTEVDCLNDEDEICEIKSKAAPKNSPKAKFQRTVWTDVDYFKTIWIQMLFGVTQKLIIGIHSPVPGVKITKDHPPPVIFNELVVKSFSQVAQLARMDKPHQFMPSLAKLSALLEWIRANIEDGEDKTFSFSVAENTFTLAPTVV